MSGGHFEYNQYKIGEIAKDIGVELERCGKEIPKEDNFYDDNYLEKIS